MDCGMPWIPEEQIGYNFVGEKFILAGDTISLSKCFIGKTNMMELTTEVTLPENRERLPCFVLDAALKLIIPCHRLGNEMWEAGGWKSE
jgi:hypothetical protein